MPGISEKFYIPDLCLDKRDFSFSVEHIISKENCREEKIFWLTLIKTNVLVFPKRQDEQQKHVCLWME